MPTASPSSAIPCGSGTCPRFRRCGGSGPPRHRSSRASPAPTKTAIPLERCLPANQTPRWIRPTASPLFAGKPGSNRNRNPVGARLARDSDAAVDQTHRVTALRGQARLQQKPQSPVGAVLARDSDAAMSQAHRVTALRGQARLQQKPQSPVGAVLARDSDAAVDQAHRVIVLRGQARLEKKPQSRWSEACPRFRRRDESGPPR